MTEARPKYRNPPIQEAVFELHFDTPRSASKESLALLQPVWAADYPNQKIVEEKNVNFQLGPEGIKTEEQRLGHRLVCRSGDETRLVQVSSAFLAVNQLKPYLGWEESFRDTIQARAKEFQESCGPFRFRRVGLRYINRLDIPQSPLVWEDWFQLSLPVPKLPEAQPPNFQMQFAVGLTEGCRLAVAIAVLPLVQTGISSVIMDLDVVWEGAPLESTALGGCMEMVHRPHRLAFEGYLSEKLRRLFY